MHSKHIAASLSLVSRPFTDQWRGWGKQASNSMKGLANYSSLAWTHGCIPVVSIVVGENAMLTNQILNSTDGKEIFLALMPSFW